ncbi:MAG: metallophosphoesterase [Oscillospiraceae bacterium]
MARQRRKHHFWRNLLILIVLFGIYLYWGNRSIETDEATFTSAALPAGFDGCRIVQLSDLHGKYFGKDNERLYSAVKAAQPEYIFVTGDLVDRKTENPTVYAGEVGAALSAIAPTYYVTGNHEWGHGTKVVEEIKRTLRETGVTVLSNEFVPLTRNGDSIVLAGIDDPNGYADQETPQELAQEVYAKYGDPFWLLLAHRNNSFTRGYSLLGADLTFSGHAHGGIWRLPFIDGLVDTPRNLFPSFTSGFYPARTKIARARSVFVSRGLGNSPRVIPRILNRPQVAVITLERG